MNSVYILVQKRFFNKNLFKNLLDELYNPKGWMESFQLKPWRNFMEKVTFKFNYEGPVDNL